MKQSLFALFCTACIGLDTLKSSEAENTENSSTEENNDAVIAAQEEIEEDPYFEESSIPNVLEEMDSTICDDISAEFPDVAGATSYFAGSYAKINGEWYGREKWILFPNERWQEIATIQWLEGDTSLSNIAQGYPCEISWDMNVQEMDEFTACPACDIALSVEATLSFSSTNCPQGLWSEPSEQNWQTVYEIASINGEAIFYFRSNGAPFGWGYSTENELNFLTEPNCKWF